MTDLTVIDQLSVWFIGYDVDRMAVGLFRLFEYRGIFLEFVFTIDDAGRVVWRVDDDGPRLGTELFL